MELHTPYLLPRLSSGLDTLNGGVVTVDEEWFPAFWEGVGELEGILVILTDESPLALSMTYKKHNKKHTNLVT